MSVARSLDPVLLRQLKKAGISEPDSAPSAEAWNKFLAAVNEHYHHINEGRTLLMRSMEVSTSEMEELRRRVEGQRDQLRAVVDVIGDALGLFGNFVQDSSGTGSGEATGALTQAKAAFSRRLQAIFPEEDQSSADSSQISGIHTNIVQLADQLIRLVSETAEKASMKKELEVARVVQALLVPNEDIIDRTSVRIAGHYQPASECGGDWWAVYDLPEGKVLTLIGDVTGHGISSAIITGAAKAACDLTCHISNGLITPSDLLRMMNSAIHETARRHIMMTCLAAVFDPNTQTMTVANAGHHFPYHIRDGHLRPVMVHGQPLGAALTSTYEPVEVQVASKDVFVWFTDGIVESENDRGEQFSEKRLRAICQRTASGGAQAVRDAVVAAVRAFSEQSSPQADDMTLVAVSLK